MSPSPTTTVSPELARTLRSARGERSLREVHQDSGVAVSYLHRLEHGRVAEPGPNVLRRLAAALGVPYATLMRLAGYLPD